MGLKGGCPGAGNVLSITAVNTKRKLLVFVLWKESISTAGLLPPFADDRIEARRVIGKSVARETVFFVLVKELLASPDRVSSAKFVS